MTPTNAEALAIAEALEKRLDCSSLVLTADVERAAAELRRLSAENVAAVSSFLSADEERIRLRAERDALRADAERYRWLRNEAWGGNNKRGPHLVEFKPGYVPSRFTELAEEAADAAIDAAMKGTQ